MSNYLSNIVEFRRNNVHESSDLKEQHVEDSMFHGHLFYIQIVQIGQNLI